MDTRWIELCGDAMDMDDGAVAQLETALLHDPENLALRVRLLGTLIRRSLPRGDQLRWLVQHHPELELGGFALLSRDQEPESYAAIRAIWQEHLAASPDSLALLERAAFFLGHEDPDCAVRLLQHAMTLQPDRARWPEQIGYLFMRESRWATTDEERAALAARAQQGFERALPLERSAFRRHLQLCHIAQTAALAHAHERARDAAEQVLREAHEHESTWQYGNSIHHANIALGHVAFDQGDVHEAGLKLLAAGATRGSPQLDSYGPDLCLASRLLGLGERTVVVRYLRACGRFWAQPERLGGWIRRIESGELTVLDDDEDEDAAGEPGKEDGSA